jgi:hypothetical protein
MKMRERALRAPEAGRRLGLTTKETLRLMYHREIRTVVVEGIAHVPESAIDEYKATQA